MHARVFWNFFLAAGLFAPTPPSARAADHVFGRRDQPVIVIPDPEGLVVTVVNPDDLPAKIFKVGRVGETGQPTRQDLLAVFTAFQTQYTTAADGKIVSAAPWKNDGLARISVTLQQAPQNGFYLLGMDAAHFILLKAPAPPAWALGDKLELLTYKTGVQAWTDATGAARKSPVYDQLSLPLPAAQPAAPSREQFIAALRAGQTFTILVREKSASGERPGLLAQKLVW